MSQQKERLRRLMAKFGRSRFRYLEIRDGETVVTAVQKNPGRVTSRAVLAPEEPAAVDAGTGKVPKPSIPAPEMRPPDAQPVTPQSLRSARVGHFYLTISKGMPDILTPGAVIEAGQVVGIIEAMKIKYEVKAERAGVVAEVLVENGEAVEFGQPLARLQEGPVAS